MKETISITNFSGPAAIKVSGIVLLLLLANSSSTLEFLYYCTHLYRVGIRVQPSCLGFWYVLLLLSYVYFCKVQLV